MNSRGLSLGPETRRSGRPSVVKSGRPLALAFFAKHLPQFFAGDAEGNRASASRVSVPDNPEINSRFS
jgi:hypothetical protein